jgi:hypothetical protein
MKCIDIAAGPAGTARLHDKLAKLLAATLIVAFLDTGARAEEPETSGPSLDVSVGAFTLDLPSMRFVSLQDDAFSVGTVSREDNHDGRLDGSRFDAAFETPIYAGSTLALTGAIAGFYGSASGRQTTDCVDTADLYCYVPMIVDDPTRGEGLFTTTEGEIFRTDAQRSLVAWGIAAKAILGSTSPGPNSFDIAAGVDFRRLDQSARLHSVYIGDDPEAPDELYSTYDESLVTDYLGAFISARGKIGLWRGGSLNVDGQIGAYDASARYRGNELQVYTGTPDDNYSASLSRSHFAAVAVARAELRQNFGRVSIGLFDKFEWYSWAPAMEYNDNDVAGSDTYPGQQTGTEIGNGSIWTNTFGVNGALNF